MALFVWRVFYNALPSLGALCEAGKPASPPQNTPATGGTPRLPSPRVQGTPCVQQLCHVASAGGLAMIPVPWARCVPVQMKAALGRAGGGKCPRRDGPAPALPHCSWTHGDSSLRSRGAAVPSSPPGQQEVFGEAKGFVGMGMGVRGSYGKVTTGLQQLLKH